MEGRLSSCQLLMFLTGEWKKHAARESRFSFPTASFPMLNETIVEGRRVTLETSMAYSQRQPQSAETSVENMQDESLRPEFRSVAIIRDLLTRNCAGLFHPETRFRPVTMIGVSPSWAAIVKPTRGEFYEPQSQ